ncbi:MAG TPA: co-chaperone GroES [Patescibacteria group bacterium]
MAKTLSVSQIKPLAGYILVEPADTEKQTASGIYLPDSHEEKPQHGTVLAVGAPAMIEGAEVKAQVKKGDQVLYKKWGGNEVKIDDKEYQILKFEDVLAVLG